jgi:hypothetical protein
MNDNQKETFKQLCNAVGDSMKHTSELMTAVFTFVLPLEMEKTPEKVKMVKKRMPRKAKTVEKKEPTSDILTLNANAPIADHHYGDKGKGEIEFDRLE